MPHAIAWQAIWFDFDGVLIDSVPLKREAFQRVVESVTTDQLPAVMDYYMTQGGISRRTKFQYIWQTILGRCADDQAIDQLAGQFETLVREQTIQAEMIGGADDFLTRFADVLPLFVISGTPQDELRSIVDARGLSDRFSAVFGSPRSKATIGRAILDEQGFDPSAVVFVGDATTDRDAARTLGVRFVGVHGPHLSPFRDGSETMIDDLTQLPSVLGL